MLWSDLMSASPPTYLLGKQHSLCLKSIQKAHHNHLHSTNSERVTGLYDLAKNMEYPPWQCTETILSLLDSNYLRLLIVPAKCTDRLQPLDVSVNKPVKKFLQRKFQQWYSEEVRRQIQSDKAVKVDLAMSIVKPLGAQWLIDLDLYMLSNPSLIINGLKGCTY